jgi:hypothetical protein
VVAVFMSATVGRRRWKNFSFTVSKANCHVSLSLDLEEDTLCPSQCRPHWQGIVQVGEHNVLVHRPLQDSWIAPRAVEQTMSEACSNKHCD